MNHVVESSESFKQIIHDLLKTNVVLVVVLILQNPFTSKSKHFIFYYTTFLQIFSILVLLLLFIGQSFLPMIFLFTQEVNHPIHFYYLSN
jgi:hypothetical protein